MASTSGLKRLPSLSSQASVDVAGDRKWKNWDSGGGNRSTAFGVLVPGRRKFITEQISRGLGAALKHGDETFLACMCLGESKWFGLIELPFPDEDSAAAESRGSYSGAASSSTAASLGEFFSEMATEERKRADLIFQCLFASRGNEEAGDGDGEEEEEEEELDESSSCSYLECQVPQSDPMESLKWIIQRRADQIARLLQLKERAERTGDAVAASFLSDLRLFRIGEDTNKRARQIIMFLEVQERLKTTSEKNKSR